jgi:hypothetical protein
MHRTQVFFTRQRRIIFPVPSSYQRLQLFQRRHDFRKYQRRPTNTIIMAGHHNQCKLHTWSRLDEKLTYPLQPSRWTRRWSSTTVCPTLIPLSRAIGSDKDPDMFVNRHKYFRWTRRTAGITFAYVIAFPAFIGYLAYTTDVSAPERAQRNKLTLAGKMGYERKAEGRHYC